ncbi:helix-turn-helix domain-containing protein [Actinoallomurus iriomotensis]|uniref:AraC family transcriptional regulator n=1 Tax=Actinoallomurus iriomotensis TaxID=478107 RepID=A0A9W6RK87_9ACTN|nr:helix-turn-helix domain-containing protein [Actinoallomurus iriomotensis]GLY77681.1 AraC family transcriptional regulator [Actinoallomurus iriomotensis]
MEVCSSDVPVADRFDWWCELTAQDLVPTRFAVDSVADFRTSARQLELGRLTALVLECSGVRSVVRTHHLVQRSDPEWWELMLVLEGSYWIEQGRNRACLEAGDLVMYDTSRPYESGAIRGVGDTHSVMLHLPRQALPVPEQALRSLVARPMPSRAGAGVLMARFLEGLAEQATVLRRGVTDRLESAAIGLATAFLAGLTDTECQIPPQTRQQALLQQIKTFVFGNLHDPDLSPAMIAAAHHISVRYLHHLFHEDGRSLGELIRRQRLERCRADLADPRLINRTVADVGAQWGFQDAATFNRAFKAAYGVPPGEHRRRIADLRRTSHSSVGNRLTGRPVMTR